ncbi:hypothetical protein LCM20_00970 [Halobacillus litoralis]|uniref:hypothetical protein n=1 Tax=Halobacillus litoralis TaxID=45668 RepID=UPI001CD75C16|nr:hypothetical protein [Halobacillus litoralis]MCA0969156.1 hypothetical protein [Halobacillus litoralis]
MRKPEKWIVSIILLLAICPYYLVQYFDFYPNAFDSTRTATGLEIHRMDQTGQVVETYEKDNGKSFGVETENGEIVYIYLLHHLTQVKTWYEQTALYGGLALGAFLFLLLPNRIVRSAFALPIDMQAELKKDAPRFYREINSTFNLFFMKAILLFWPLYLLYEVWNGYPAESLEQIQFYIDATLK